MNKTNLPCGRSEFPQAQHLHQVFRSGDLGAVINNLTGAWLGGGAKEIGQIFEHLKKKDFEVEALSQKAQEEIQRSGLACAPVPDTIFKPHLAVIHVGHVCNIDCTYCYAPKNTGAMSDQAIQRVTDFLAKLPHEVFVQFMGGEPLIYRDQIAKIVDQLNEKRRGQITTYGLQTNGLYLLDSGVMEFLDERKIRFGISYDGPGEMSEARFGPRLDFHQKKLDETVRELKSRGYNFGILSVLNRSNKFRLPELVDWCLERDVHHLLVNPLLLGQGQTQPHALTDEEAAGSMQQLFRYWVDHSLYKTFDIENFQAFEDNITDVYRPYMCRKQHCGAGREQLAFDTEGKIFPCDYLVGETKFCLGSVDTLQPKDVQHSAHMAELREQVQPTNLEVCGDCPMFAFCGNCMASSYFRDGTLHGRRGSCHTDFTSIQDIIFELLSNKEYCEHVLDR